MLSILGRGLFIRLTCAFLLVGLVPVVGAGWLGIRATQRQGEERAGERLEEIAEVVALLAEEAVARAMGLLKNVGVLLAKELEARPLALDAGPANRRLVETLASRVDPPDQFLELAYFNATRLQGQRSSQIASVSQVVSPLGQSTEQREEARRMELVHSELVHVPKKTGQVFRDPSLSTYEYQVSLRFSVPVAEPGGRGALVGYIDFRMLRDLVEETFGANYRVVVSDSLGKDLLAVGIPEGLDLGEAKYATQGAWSVRVKEPMARAGAPLKAAKRRVMRWTLAAVALAILLSVLLSTWITKPVAVLHGAAERMAAGDLTARANLDRGDELGRLGMSFDRMADAMQQLDQAKEAFVGNVSHELRSPLTALVASIANVTDGVLGGLNPAQEKALKRAKDQAGRMGEMVEVMLTLARLDAGQGELSRVPTDLSELAQTLVLSWAQADRSRIEVSGSGHASCDPTLARRALENLIANGLKFGPGAGKIRVLVQDGQIAVQDDGPGIDDARLFERFHQGMEGGVKASGTGIGLSIVARIASLHGGRVWSSKDQGSEVTIRFGEPT